MKKVVLSENEKLAYSLLRDLQKLTIMEEEVFYKDKDLNQKTKNHLAIKEKVNEIKKQIEELNEKIEQQRKMLEKTKK